MSFWALHAQKLEHSFIMASTSMQTWEMGKGLPEGPEWAFRLASRGEDTPCYWSWGLAATSVGGRELLNRNFCSATSAPP